MWSWSHTQEAYYNAQRNLHNRSKKWLDEVWAEWQTAQDCPAENTWDEPGMERERSIYLEQIMSTKPKTEPLTEQEAQTLCTFCKDLFGDEVPCNCNAFKYCPARNLDAWISEGH